MCELTVKCPLCEATCFPRQEIACFTSASSERGVWAAHTEWACVCGATVTLDAMKPRALVIKPQIFEVQEVNQFATGQKFPGEG